MKAKEILKDMPSVKQGLDDFYGRQTVLNALNKVLNQNKELIENNKHLQNYAGHTEFCSWKMNGNGICDCGYIKTKHK